MTIHEDIVAAYERLAPAHAVDKSVLIDGYYSAWYSSPRLRTADFEQLDSIEWDGDPWTFNMTAVFHHKPSGALFYATDSGCSCPSPFENTTTAHLEPIARIQDWLDHVERNTGRLRRDEEDIRLGRLEDASYRPWDRLDDMQQKLSFITDRSFRVFNTISDHFETHDIIPEFTVSLVKQEDDEDENESHDVE